MADTTCDVAVVGAGPAGIAAAVTAAEAGAAVVVVDEAPLAGGQIWRHRRGDHPPRAARSWLHRLDVLVRTGRISFLPSTTVVDVRSGRDRHLLLLQNTASPACGDVGAAAAPQSQGGAGASRARRLDAAAVVLACGARELFLPFPGWTLPGVTGAGGAQALLKAGLDVRGRRALVAGTGPLLLAAAAALSRAGARVVAVAEQAPTHRVLQFAARMWSTPYHLLHAAALRSAFARAPYMTGWWVTCATGDGTVTGAVLTDGVRTRSMECDLLCTGYMLTPAVELGLLFGCVLQEDALAHDDAQRTSVPGVFCAGEVSGIEGVASAIVAGQIAGRAAADQPAPTRLLRRRARHARFARAMLDAFALRPELRQLAADDTIVCRCEDVRHGELRGFGSAREAKLLSRAGMGPCQGRICGAAQRFMYGWADGAARPPVLPATVGSMMRNTAPVVAQGDD